ncbi:MAG: alpha/beta hydrolase [Bryobacterales bacterium]|nr:alpha/beta hydrolase [Bryobacterales bacterium]
MLSRRKLFGSALMGTGAWASEPALETFVYKRTRNCEIKADVIRPPGNERCPTILWIHGGALIFGSRKSLWDSRREQALRLVRAGFALACIDYRLAPETKIGGILTDLGDAWKWLKEEGPKRFAADTSRLSVMGQSAGGYLTLMSGIVLRPRPRALVSFYGYGDIAGDWYAKPDPFYSQQPAVSKEEALAVVGTQEIAEPPPGKDRLRFYLYCRQQGLWPKLVTGYDPHKERRDLRRFCPLDRIDASYPPTMLLHGDKDTDVPFQQSQLMTEALKKLRVPAAFVQMSGMGHSFDRDMKNPRVSAAFDGVIDFLRRYST